MREAGPVQAVRHQPPLIQHLVQEEGQLASADPGKLGYHGYLVGMVTMGYYGLLWVTMGYYGLLWVTIGYYYFLLLSYLWLRGSGRNQNSNQILLDAILARCVFDHSLPCPMGSCSGLQMLLQ